MMLLIFAHNRIFQATNLFRLCFFKYVGTHLFMHVVELDSVFTIGKFMIHQSLCWVLAFPCVQTGICEQGVI